MFFGGLAGGRIADRHGRRRTYLTSLSLFALLYSLSPFAPSFAAYCLMKFGIGYAPPDMDMDTHLKTDLVVVTPCAFTICRIHLDGD